MKNRDAVTRKLEGIESNLNKLNFTLNQGDREACYENIEAIREQVSQIKLYIETEPIAGGELNPNLR